MINEKEILRREEVDFRGVINRFKRGWPVVMLMLAGWIVIGAVFQLSFPPRYEAKTSIMINKPKGPDDPGTIMSMMQSLVKTDDYFYNNQKVVLRSYPLLRKSVENVGLITYYKRGLFNTELHKTAPFIVELDSSYMSFKDYETPYSELFKVSFDDFNTYSLEVKGKYPVSDNDYEITGTFNFGEWIRFDQTKFRILPADTAANPMITKRHDIFDSKFGFIIRDANAATLDIINSMEVEQEELESTVFGLYLAGGSPARQLEFLDVLGKTFIANHIENKTRPLRHAIEFLEQEIAETEQRLTTSGAQIEEYKTERSITSLNREGTLLLEQSVNLENKKVNHMVKDRYYNYLEEFLKESDDYESLISPQAFGIKDELIIRLTDDLVTAQQEMRNIEAMGTRDNPIYKQLQGKIESNRATIMRSISGFKSSNKMMIENLDSRIRQMQEEASELPRAHRELMEMERFFRVNEKLYITLMEKKSEAQMLLVSTTPDFSIIEPPFLTTVDPKLPFLPITIIAAIIFGLLFGFIYLFIKWVFNTKLDNLTDVRRHLPGALVLGEVFHTNITKPTELMAYPQSTLAQNLSNVQYSLQRHRPDSGMIALGAPSSKNGKTFMASMLGVRYAQMGYKTLIVDANFKNPSAKKNFKLGQPETMFDVLEGKISLEEACMPSGTDNLHVAEFGKRTDLTDREIKAAAELLEKAKAEYDKVIVDTSPYGNLSAALYLLNAADASIVVLRRNVTGYGEMSHLRDQVLEGILSDPLFVVTDTFDDEESLSLFKRRPKYTVNKPWGLFGSIRRLFTRV